MAAATRSAAMKIDWAKISTSLGLKGQTAAALQAFKKRNDDARRKLNQLSAQATTVDFASYRDTLENRTIVDQIEAQFKQFKPQMYDVSRQIKAIEAFEVQAVKSAEETKGKVDAELKDLKQALTNIETTRPWEDMTTDDILAANPDVEKATEKMVANHQWMPAGYKEKFGDLSVL